jgi:hypothetical protein
MVSPVLVTGITGFKGDAEWRDELLNDPGGDFRRGCGSGKEERPCQ